MNMLPIHDAEARFAVMKYLAGLIDSGHIEPLIVGGLTPELLDALRSCRLGDITRIALDPSIGFHLKLDAPRLTTAFMRLNAIARDTMLIEHFVRHGAPPQMLTRLFRVSNTELRAMREALGPCTSRPGRPSLPDDAVRDQIHAAWQHIRAQAPKPPVTAVEGFSERREREHIYSLSLRFPHYSIAALWTVLNEFGNYCTPVGGETNGGTGGKK